MPAPQEVQPHEALPPVPNGVNASAKRPASTGTPAATKAAQARKPVRATVAGDAKVAKKEKPALIGPVGYDSLK
jgi:hypothetical protein